MKKRVLSGVMIVGILLLLLVFSEYIVFSIGFSVLAVVAVFEMLRVMGVHKKLALAIPAYLLAAIFPIIAFFVKDEQRQGFILIMAACFFIYMLWLMGVSVFSKGRIPFSKTAEVFCAITYISVSFTSLTLVRYISEYGYFFVILAFLIPWICDVFAFLIGSKLGKHKLIPEVSPKKSVEGAIAGILFTVFFCLLFGLVVDLIFEEVTVNYIALAVYGLILSVVSQLGDLVASVIKRQYGAKDYGKIFPGHGGVMDRFDSVLGISTILLILCLVWPPLTVVPVV